VAQYALPVSDNVTTNWTEDAGDGDGNAFDELDEGFGAGRGSGSGPDDATTYWGTTVDLAQISTIIGALIEPAVDTGHIVRIRSRKSAAAGQQQDHRVNINFANPNTTFSAVDEVWTSREVTLTEAQASSLATHYDTGELTLFLRVDEVGGGAGRVGQCSAMEFECPDYPATPAFADAKLPAQNSYVGPFSS